MIFKQERLMTEIHKSAPEIGAPFKGVREKAPSRFYERNQSLSQAVAGYRKGQRNPVVEKMMEI